VKLAVTRVTPHTRFLVFFMYKFLGLPSFIREFMTTRILFISGHKGTGKTLLCVALGYEMMRTRYVVNSAFNFPVASSFGGVPSANQTYGAIDEAGVIFDARTAYKNKKASEFITESTTWLRKTGSFLVAPTYTPPDVRLRNGLRCWRVVALPFAWGYRWEMGPEAIEERNKENYKTGRFWLYRPSFFYGAYDTYFQPPPSLTYRFLESFLRDALTLPEYAGY